MRYAFRLLRLHPGTTAAAVLSLALGVGGATAVFGVLDAVVLKPLPVSRPDRLVSLTLVLRQGVFDNFSFRQFEEFRRAPAWEEMCAWSAARFEMPWGESVAGQAVSAEYFRTLGIAPAIGRFPDAGEKAVVISYRLWERRFQESAAVPGQYLDIAGQPLRIAAVTPAGFFGTEIGSLPDVFVPLAAAPPDAARLKVVGRLARGATVAQAGAQLNASLQYGLLDLVRAAPAGTPEEMKRDFLDQRIELVPGGAFSPVRRGFAGPLAVLMALVGLVLLIACGNVANLLLARAVARRHEMEIRSACGAGRGHIVRQLLVEGLALSVPGAAAGAVLALWLRPVLASMFNTGRISIGLAGGADARFLGFAAALAVLTGLLFGLVPAFGRGLPAGKVLVAAQVAVAMCLLVGAGLFARTLANLRNVNAGFDRHQVVLMRVHQESGALYGQLLDAVRRIPGVQAASLSRFTPIESSDFSDPILISGEKLRVRANFAEPEFFATMGTPILAGRDFGGGDAAHNVAIVNESLAKRAFPGANPVGQQLRLAGANGAAFEIVGVARDMKYRDLRDAVPLTVFYSALNNSSRLGSPQLSARVRGGAGGATEAIRRRAAALGIAVSDSTTMDAQIDDSLVRERALAHLSSGLGLLALLLTGVGLYGVISYGTARRTREIGIRMALGAEPSAVVRPIVRETLVMVAGGIAAGLPGVWFAVRAIKVGLFGVTPWDPVTIAGSGAVLLLVALVAGYVPARRASRVNPMVALRME